MEYLWNTNIFKSFELIHTQPTAQHPALNCVRRRNRSKSNSRKQWKCVTLQIQAVKCIMRTGNFNLLPNAIFNILQTHLPVACVRVPDSTVCWYCRIEYSGESQHNCPYCILLEEQWCYATMMVMDKRGGTVKDTVNVVEAEAEDWDAEAIKVM